LPFSTVGGMMTRALLSENRTGYPAPLQESAPSPNRSCPLFSPRLAGLAVGFWKNQADIAQQWQVDKRFKPAMKSAARVRITKGWERALGRAKAWEES
jgi:hypothetical protein